MTKYGQIRGDYYHAQESGGGGEGGPERWPPVCNSQVVTNNTNPVMISPGQVVLAALLIKQGVNLATVKVYDTDSTLSLPNVPAAVLCTQGMAGSMDGGTSLMIQLKSGLVIQCDQTDAYTTVIYF